MEMTSQYDIKVNKRSILSILITHHCAQMEIWLDYCMAIFALKVSTMIECIQKSSMTSHTGKKRKLPKKFFPFSLPFLVVTSFEYIMPKICHYAKAQ